MKKNFILLTFFLCLLISSCIKSNNEVATLNNIIDTVSIEEIDSISIEDTWYLKYFIDEFGEETKSGYLLSVCYGAFSNSATTNSNLTADIIVSADNIRFDLYEYGDNLMKGEGTLEFRAKLPDNTEVHFNTYNDREGANSVNSSDLETVRNLFKNYSKIRFAARTLSSYSTSTYRFVYEGSPQEFETDLTALISK